MNAKSVFHVIAWLLGVVGLLMGVSAALSFFYGEPFRAWSALAISSAGTVLVSALLWTATRNKRELSRRDGLGVVAFGWFLAGLAGAVPFYLAGIVDTPSAAIFESFSGMTATGATVLANLEAVPKGFLFWRALMQFIGGMGVLVLVMAVLPFVGAGGMQLYRAEMPGPSKDRVEPRMASTAKMLWGVYATLTLLLIVILRLLGVDWFDAVCHGFATMSTGGFSTHTASVAAFQSKAVEGVLMVFMLLAAMNFTLHYRALRGEFAPWWKDNEIRFFLGTFLAVSVLGGVLLHRQLGLGCGGAFRQMSFTTASIMTTTGYATVNYNTWSGSVKTMLLFLMFMGGCAGSTAGGIKVGRILVVGKTIVREIRLFMQSQAVIPVRMGRKFLNDAILLEILGFTALYIVITLAGILLLIPFTPDIQTTVSSVVACIGNVGPGFAAAGPASSYAGIPTAGQLILALLMLVGRLELYTVLVIFLPAFWRK